MPILYRCRMSVSSPACHFLTRLQCQVLTMPSSFPSSLPPFSCCELIPHYTVQGCGFRLPPSSKKAPQRAWWSHWKDSSASLCKPRARSVGSPLNQPHHLSNRLLDPSAFPGTKAVGLSNKGKIVKRGCGQIAASPQSCR